MSTEVEMIDLKQYKTSEESRVFSGRPRGEFCRSQMGLDSLDKSRQTINILVPNDTYIINMSFFLGLFGPSVRHLGKEGFFNHYAFRAPEPLQRILSTYADEALKDAIALP